MTRQDRLSRMWSALGALGLAGALGTVVWMHPRTLAREDRSEAQTSPARSTRASTRSDDANGRSDIQAKFDTVFENQQAILEEMKAAAWDERLLKS